MDAAIPGDRTAAEERRTCSFCGRECELSRLVSGLGAYMCDDCVARYAAAARVGRAESAPRPADEALSDAEVLQRLPLIAHTGVQVDRALVDAVWLARRRRLSWAQVGAALGTTRQAAWERFSRLTDAADDRATGRDAGRAAGRADGSGGPDKPVRPDPPDRPEGGGPSAELLLPG